MLDKKKVVIGMSGGVDSAVAAYVLQEQGYEVIGITMKLWEEDKKNYTEDYSGCCSLSSAEDARLVAEKLGIPFYVINYQERFIDTVIDNYVEEYLNGRTPCPCIRCNKYMKFGELLNTAHSLGAYYVATGHFGVTGYNKELDRYTISKSKEQRKDQTYMMYTLSQDQIKHILMPLGNFTSKEEVRQIAERENLIVARKKDSQEACFIIDNDYARFVKDYSTKKISQGNFIDKNGHILGQHMGIIHYTIGQRKGLGIAFGKPTYVIEIRSETNEVVVGDNENLFKSELIAKEVNFIIFKDLQEPYRCHGKIRYSSSTAPCTIYPLDDDRIKVLFDTPQRAVAPGQSVVFYDNDLLVGGAVIE